MKRFLMWLFLLNKRLYKKPAFIAVLVLIPLLVAAMGIVSRSDSGFINIALAQENPDDEISSTIVSELLSGNRLIRFTEYDQPSAAVNAVSMGGADAAWIFPADMQKKVERFVDSRFASDYVVSVVEREQNVALRLSHEKLSGVLFKYCSNTLYINYIRENVPQLDGLSEEQLMKYYDDFIMDGELFSFEYPKNSSSAQNVQNIGYLLAPMRGMLAVVVVLCGLSAAVFYIQDERNGTFSWIPQRKRSLVAFASQFITVVNVSAVMLISLGVIGLTVSLAREVLMLLLFALCTTLFCMVLSQIFHSVKSLGTVSPLAVVIMIAVCPVFFDIKSLRVLQFAFPPTYYINSAYNNKFLVFSLIYCVSCALIYMVLRVVLKRNR